jgi:putative ABC transport system permease protein
MLKNYFKTAYRQLFKNRLFSLVNVAGLSMGLASIMALSILVYQFETSDSNQKDINQMYYLKTRTPEGAEYKATTYPLLGEIVRTCPEVEAATHIQTWYFPWLKYGSKEFQETTNFVDTGYFKVFTFPFKYGNPATALASKFSIVLSEETANKIFGDQDPVGKTIVADDSVQLRVTGVLRHVPANSTIRPTVLLPTALLEANADFKGGANWYNTFADDYLRLTNAGDPKRLDEKIAGIVKLNYAPEEKNVKVFSVPFSKIGQENSTLISVIIKGAIGASVFILLIIGVNLVNLNTASMYARAKEVAIKQMIGGTKKDIIIQFCVENGLIVLVSAVFAWLLFSSLLLPMVDDLIKDRMGEMEMGLAKDYPLILMFIGIGLVFTLVAASLPALKLVAIKVTDAVKGQIVSGHSQGGGVRNIFITVQFVLAITFICVTIILGRQIAFMKTSALGFNSEDVGVVNLDLAFRNQAVANTRFESLLNDLRKNPHIRGISTNQAIPTAYYENYNSYVDPLTNKEVQLRQAPADAGYLPTYQISLIQGRNFDDALSASQKNAVLINRSAMNAFGWTNAIGKQIKSKEDPTLYTILGVMEDFHYQDLQSGVQPIIHWYGGKASLENRFLSLRTDPEYLVPVMEQLQVAFKSMPSRRSFSYEFMRDRVDKQYALLDGILKATNYIALLTILIASLGMFGLIALFAKLRVKEIGIRKVLGASVETIVRLLSKDYLLLVGIAFLIASPLAWFIMNRWLMDFAYRVEIKWWMFGLAGLMALSIALLTVGFQAIKAALVNPVKSLRTE